MPFCVEVALLNTDAPPTVLGTWDRCPDARHACEQHAEHLLDFSERWRGLWQARTEATVYHIILVSG